jgi:hypothetical protein
MRNAQLPTIGRYFGHRPLNEQPVTHGLMLSKSRRAELQFDAMVLSQF